MPYNLPTLPDYASSCRVNENSVTVACDSQNHDYRNIFVQTLAQAGEGLDVEQVDEMFYCPISTNFMEDPVVTKHGITYERSLIERWIRQSHNDPLTRRPLRENEIRRNDIAKQVTQDYLRVKNQASGASTSTEQTVVENSGNRASNRPPRENKPPQTRAPQVPQPGLRGRSIDDVLNDFRAKLESFTDNVSHIGRTPVAMSTLGTRGTYDLSDSSDDDNIEHTSNVTGGTTYAPFGSIFGSAMTVSLGGDATTSTGDYTTVSSSQSSSTASSRNP